METMKMTDEEIEWLTLQSRDLSDLCNQLEADICSELKLLGFTSGNGALPGRGTITRATAGWARYRTMRAVSPMARGETCPEESTVAVP